jgi:adenine phosphoribosyltransferase
MSSSDAKQPQTTPQGKDVEYIKSLVTSHENFPIEGVTFRDIFPVLRDPVASEMLISCLYRHIASEYGNSVDVIVGLDSRGFLFGPVLAQRLGCSFVPIRKHGKLPGQCTTVTYAKEYGEDKFDVQNGSIEQGARVVIVDDLLATGGTLDAAEQLIAKVGGVVLSSVVAIDLPGLNGAAKLKNPVYALLSY